MKRNIGNIELIIRFFAAITFADLGADLALSGNWSWPFWIAAIILMTTVITGYCPLNALLHIHRHDHGKQHQ